MRPVGANHGENKASAVKFGRRVGRSRSGCSTAKSDLDAHAHLHWVATAGDEPKGDQQASYDPLKRGLTGGLAEVRP